MNKLFHLTQTGIDELSEELAGLKAQRPEIADRIKQARQLGDLSENAEYQTAREEQDKLESRIGEVEHILHNTEVIKKPKASGVVKLGSIVKLKTGSREVQFQVVGTIEADPMSGKISDESPIGQELLGKKIGEKIEIKANSHSATYELVEIS